MKSADLYATLERMAGKDVSPGAGMFWDCLQKGIFQLTDCMVQRAQWLSLGFGKKCETGSLQGLSKPCGQDSLVMTENLGAKGLYFLRHWYKWTEGLMRLFLMACEAGLDTDTPSLGEGQSAARAHAVLFSSHGCFCKGNFKNTKGVKTYRTLWALHYLWCYWGWKLLF